MFLCSHAGKRGLLLSTPRILGSEKHSYIMREIDFICEARYKAFGEAGCPIAFVTDNIRRDKKALVAFLRRKFPGAMAQPGSAPALCQDIIHREWAFERAFGKMHPDVDSAKADVKAIFGRLT